MALSISDSNFEKDIDKRIKNLEKSLKVHSDNIYNIMNEAMANPSAKTSYWVEVRRKLDKEYTELSRIYRSWSKVNIPIVYRKSLQNLMSTLNRSKKIAQKASKNFTTLATGGFANKASTMLYLSANQDYITALKNGKEELYRLTRRTQQRILSESLIDKNIANAIKDGNISKLYNPFNDKSLAKYFRDSATMIDNQRFVIVNGRKYTPEYYAEMVTRVKFHEAQTLASIQTAKNYNTSLLKVSNHNTPTEICQNYENKIYSIDGKDSRFPTLESTPPFHVNCYSDDTEVYTNKGWLLFKDLKGDELFLSLDKSKNLHYVKAKKAFIGESEKMIHFKNINTNILVTPDHNMYFQNDHNRKMKNNKFEFRKAKDLLGLKSGRFYCSSEWIGDNTLSDDFMEFMGYYLSEGSAYQASKNSWRVSISQCKKVNKNKYTKMYNCIKKLFDCHISETSGSMVFYNPIGKYLKSFGYSHEKYVDENIKNQNKEKIKIFLDAYCLGDGTIKKGRTFKNHKFNDSRGFYTSSKKMSNDISELILKIGKRPTIKKLDTKGKPVKHKNGIYASKYDMYRINECNSNYVTLQNMEIKEIKYNRKVYCVELEKYNVLWTKREGRTVWSGNCRHNLFPVFESSLEATDSLNQWSEFSNNKTATPPAPKNFIPIDDRG